MTTPGQRERLLDSWTANADAWTATVRGGGIASRRLATDAAIVDAVMAAPPGRVLDVGCGEGWLCRALAARGVDAVGIDGAAPLVAAARAAGGGRFEHLVYADAPERLAALGTFDTVVCNFALLDEDVPPLLAALAARLSPGGRLLVQTVHPWTACGDGDYRDGWRLETFTGFGSQPFPEPMPWYFRTLASWLALLDGAGLRLAALAEPGHPENARPLSVLMTALRCG